MRVKHERNPSPSVAILDRQSVKTPQVGGRRSYDGGKKVLGRKRHIVVDTLGLLLGVKAHKAGLADSQQAPHVLMQLVGKVPESKAIFSDPGYVGTPPSLIAGCSETGDRQPTKWGVVQRTDTERSLMGDQRLVVQPKRWIVERTFAWFGGLVG